MRATFKTIDIGVAGLRSMHVMTPAPRDIWQQMLQWDLQALVSQGPAWLDAICTVGGYEDASRLYGMPDGQQAILPLVRRHRPFPWAVQASLPEAWGIGGLLTAKPLQPVHLAAVFTDLATHPVVRTSIRPNPLMGEVWRRAHLPGAVVIPRLAHVLDLEGGFAQVWSKRFDSDARNGVRKAERSGLIVESDSSGRLVPVFYQLLEQSFERWARKQHEIPALARWRGHRRDPLQKFEVIAQTLGEACRIWVAWLHGEPAATILVLQGTNAHYTRGAMNQELAGPTRANDLLQRVAIEEACRAGCRYYHMGETGASAALAHFKSRFGAVPYAYAEYRYERFPLTRMEGLLRGLVKQLIGFRDAS